MTDHPGSALLVYPHGGTVSTAFHRSVLELQAWDQVNQLGVFVTELSMRSGVNICRARNRLVQDFLKSEHEWLWWCDSDMVFEPETLLRLLMAAKHTDAKIMGALCVIVHEAGLIPTLFVDDEDTITKAAYDYPDGVVTEVAATGTGCVLVHRDVFEKMSVEAGGSDWCWYVEGERISQTGGSYWIGEDVGFFLRARECGFKVYVDCTTPVGHDKGSRIWWPKDIHDGHGKPLDEELEPGGG